jgi:2-aminoethylphosphonate-pyruvate transaminase
MKEKQYLFCPGPVMVSKKVRQALLHPDMCHRVPSFENVIQNVQNKLLEVYKANEDYAILLITGSGTAANETVISSCFTDDDEVLLISNGEFGDRLEELLQIHKVKADILKYDWGTRPDVSDVERKLKANRHITTMMMVFHETSTSVVNPVKEVGELAARYGKTYIVDGVSAVAGEDVDVVRDHIDFCTSSSNKCLASFPGVGIICANKLKIEKTKKNKKRVAYLNLYRLYQMSENLQINRHQRCARMIRDGVRKMGLRLLVEDKVASNTVSSVFLPAEISMADFIGTMEEKGFTVYAGKGPLKPQNMFQIANMGEIDEEMCHVFLKTMEETLAEFKQ